VSVYLSARRWVQQRPFVIRGRKARYERFVRECRLAPGERVLDVGAGRGGALERFNDSNPIVALETSNRFRDAHISRPNIEFVVGDGRSLPFADAEMPVVFCNSVIEHVPLDERERFASEIRRVAQRYFVQTPNRWFPIEPHYMLPLIQFIPAKLRRHLDDRIIRSYIELLDRRGLHELFPDAQIIEERRFGLTKSLMAVRR